ncbi:MAG: rRNA maturation RNase YbeY [Bacteroidota bacterium]|nr:rRNA maturation RNase YbeY [Bacteroidota bacterium]
MKPSIQFHYLFDQRFYFPHRKNLKKFLLALFKKEGYSVDTVNYIFCSDAFLLDINLEFLKHDSFTDIISFKLSDENQSIIADIYISIEQVISNSKSLNIPFKNEFHRVMFHGVLHLCGYNDKTKEEKITIRKKEDFYLGQYFCST